MPDAVDDELDRPAKTGGLGGLISFFAVGCPTCNKVVLLALGTTGALDWFAPAQPILAVLSIVLLAGRSAPGCAARSPAGLLPDDVGRGNMGA
ncbi:MAG: hypothetical protein R2697_05770 [Ilumatobacteraceae bacterium]